MNAQSWCIYHRKFVVCLFFGPIDTILAVFPSKAPLVVQAMGLQPIQASLEELHLYHPTRTLAHRVGKQLSRYTRPKCLKTSGWRPNGWRFSNRFFLSFRDDFRLPAVGFRRGVCGILVSLQYGGVDWERSWSHWLEQENRVQYLRRAHEEQVAGISSKDQS